MCDDSSRGTKKGEQMTKVTLEGLKKGEQMTTITLDNRIGADVIEAIKEFNSGEFSVYKSVDELMKDL